MTKTLQEILQAQDQVRPSNISLKEAPLWKDIEVISDSLDLHKEREEASKYTLNEFDDMDSYINFLEPPEEEELPDESFSEVYPLNLTIDNSSNIRVISESLTVRDSLPDELFSLSYEDFGYDVSITSIRESNINTISVSTFWAVSNDNTSFLGFNRLPFFYNQVITITARNSRLNTRSVYRTSNRVKKKDIIEITNLTPDSYTVSVTLDIEGQILASSEASISVTDNNLRKVLTYD